MTSLGSLGSSDSIWLTEAELGLFPQTCLLQCNWVSKRRHHKPSSCSSRTLETPPWSLPLHHSSHPIQNQVMWILTSNTSESGVLLFITFVSKSVHLNYKGFLACMVCSSSLGFHTQAKWFHKHHLIKLFPCLNYSVGSHCPCRSLEASILKPKLSLQLVPFSVTFTMSCLPYRAHSSFSNAPSCCPTLGTLHTRPPLTRRFI